MSQFCDGGVSIPPGPPPGIAKSGHPRPMKLRSFREKEIEGNCFLAWKRVFKQIKMKEMSHMSIIRSQFEKGFCSTGDES